MQVVVRRTPTEAIDAPTSPRLGLAAANLQTVVIDRNPSGRHEVPVQDDKQAVRDRVRAARAALDPAERAAASVAASQRLLSLDPVRGASTVLLYAALPDECDPSTAAEVLFEAGTRVLLPRMAGDELHLARTQRGEVLQTGRFGVREPTGPRVDVTEVDVVVVPGVAFDREGGRLGHGGGFYDRLLATLRPDAVMIGFAFASQLVDRVPREAHDLPVHLVVTEAATHRAHTPRADDR